MTNITKLTFKIIGYGHYRVTYTTLRGDYYVATITDMTLIDATKNAENPKSKDIKNLIDAVKRIGTHYSKNNKMLS